MSVEHVISVHMETNLKPVYNLAFYLNENPFGMWRFMQFDGVTGEKLEDFEKAYECRTQ